MSFSANYEVNTIPNVLSWDLRQYSANFALKL